MNLFRFIRCFYYLCSQAVEGVCASDVLPYFDIISNITGFTLVFPLGFPRKVQRCIIEIKLVYKLIDVAKFQRLLVGAIRGIRISILRHNVFYLLQDICICGGVCAYFDCTLECSYRNLQCICRGFACLLGCKASIFCVPCVADCSLQGILCYACRKSNALRDCIGSLVCNQDFFLVRCGYLLIGCRVIEHGISRRQRRRKLRLIQRVYGYARLCGQRAVVGIAAGYGYGGRCLVGCVCRRRCVILCFFAIRPFPLCHGRADGLAVLEVQRNGLRDRCQRLICGFLAVRHIECYLLSARDLLRGRAAAARTRGAVLLGGCRAVGGILLADIEVLIEGYAAGGNVQQVDPTLACQLDLRIRV